MNTLNNHRFLLSLVVLISVSLACSLVSGSAQVSPQASPVQPTEPPPIQPSDTPSSVDIPQLEATSDSVQPLKPSLPAATEEPPYFFTEEFDEDPYPDWGLYVISGDENKLTTYFDNSMMFYELDGPEIYAYYIFEVYSYDDVSLELEAENFGLNRNNVSLVCRQYDVEWYEFSVESGGLWFLYAHDDAGFNMLGSGGTKLLKMGKEVNDYGLTCQGNTITMFINGTEIKSITDNTYQFDEGAVGFNISSLDIFPIKIGVDWMEISEP